MLIRLAHRDDLPAVTTIYNEIIRTSTAIYRNDPVDLLDRIAWFEGKRASCVPLFVAVEDGVVVGFSTYGDFRSFPGYRFTVEHSIHVDAGFRGKGIGTQLLKALVESARKAGNHVMLGLIDADNQGSIRFHEDLGFKFNGRLPEVGYKFDRWLDVVLMSKML